VELIGAAAFWDRPGRNLCKDEEESADVQVNCSIMREKSAESIGLASKSFIVTLRQAIRANPRKFPAEPTLASFAHKQR